MSLAIQNAYGSLAQVLPDSNTINQYMQQLGPLTAKVAKIAAIYLVMEAISHVPTASAGVLSYNACIATCSGLLGPVCIAACVPLLHPGIP